MRNDILISVISLFALVAASGAQASELQQPVPLVTHGLSVGSSPGSTDPVGATTCSNLPPPAGRVDEAQVVVRNADRPDVGPYTVTLPGYGTGTAANSPQFYRPFLVTASPGDSIRFDIVNQLDTGSLNENDTNLHTHGLIVPPRPCTPLGDYIFVNDSSSSVTSYRIDVPPTLPGNMFSSLSTPRPYPSGLYWFHGHIHEYSDDEVGSAQSGILYIGNLLAELRAAPDLDPATSNTLANTDVLYMGLRDIQLAVPFGQTPDKAHPGQRAQWISRLDYNVGACLPNANPPIPFPLQFSGPGYCGHHVTFIGGKTNVLQDTVWMFTVNGQYNPTVTMKPGRDQIWRINNLSANLTYVLELDDNATGQAQNITALSYDGLVAGSNTNGNNGLKVGVPRTQLLLTPGNRIEVLVPNAGGPTGRQLTLRTIGITTGAQGAPWPRIDIAKVVMPPGPSPVAGLPINVTLPGLAPSLTPPTPVASNAPPPANCAVLPPGGSAHRLIEFLDGPKQGEYEIGSQVVDRFDQPIGPPSGTIQPQPFPMAAMNAPDAIPHICARLGDQEVWEIVNLSGEMHNFHIHQSKFRLSRPEDSGAPVTLLAGAYQDPSNLISPYIPELTESSNNNKLDIWRDVIALPPYGGRVFVTIPFYSPSQVGNFVYHCHILSHESGGMMAVVQVYNPS